MVKITVCDGPWCGLSAADVVSVMEHELDRLKLRNSVEIMTGCCMGACKHGPCVRINGVKHFHVEESKIPQLIREHVLPLVHKGTCV